MCCVVYPAFHEIKYGWLVREYTAVERHRMSPTWSRTSLRLRLIEKLIPCSILSLFFYINLMQLVDAQFEIFDESRYTRSLTRCYTPRFVKASVPFSYIPEVSTKNRRPSLRSELPDKGRQIKRDRSTFVLIPFNPPLSRRIKTLERQIICRFNERFPLH